MNESDGNKTESIGESASSISQRLDLNHGFVRHIRHLQQKRDKIEKEWQQEQQPEKDVMLTINHCNFGKWSLNERTISNNTQKVGHPRILQRVLLVVYSIKMLVDCNGKKKWLRTHRRGRSSSTKKCFPREASLDSNTLASATSTTQAQEINPTSNSDNATASCNINSRPEASHTYRNPGAKCITEQHNLESAAGNESKQNKHYGEFDDYEENATPVRCPIFRVEVELNHEIECIILYEGDHIPAVVREFGLEHHLTDEQIEVLADHVTREYQNALL
eukprot:gene9927-2110_t